ncbi:polyketide cyclase [Streptomyces venezuelae]|uniref:Polyketide cyclase n=1 Tax=Streptomyces venezuelae TaxID=54571 RepID=A0A5P2CUE2_STRVZ|nr:SRPBCC family protein [Streptomyces venezuelae]QES46544.1 polyketide cyclase [Streptomyces venezuelae]
MSRHDIRFTGAWRSRLSPDAVYAMLADVGAYPSWWSAFRSVRQTGEGECEVVIRALLPYALTARLTPVVEDPVARVLEASVDGDIAGSVRWTIDPDEHEGCVARFAEHVTVRKAALRLWMPLARPFFHLNHAAAMGSGRRGLAARAPQVHQVHQVHQAR